jgi:hypothetical protein
VGDVVSTVTDAVLVPVAEKGKVLDNSNLNTAAHTGSSIFGGVLSGVSWDSIAYCIGNALIAFVADSVTEWINSGFDGNPAFVDNPQQFFTDIADQTAASFVQGIVKGTTGIDICKPFRLGIGLGTLGGYNSTFDDFTKCTLDTIGSNVEGFISGDPRQFTWNAFQELSQNPANNPIGLSLAANNELQIRLNTAQGLAQKMLDRNDGYKDIIECEGEDCNTTVVGKDTAVAAQNSRNMANLRLVAATKFDQVVTALVSQLIKTALNKLNEARSESSN